MKSESNSIVKNGIKNCATQSYLGKWVFVYANVLLLIVMANVRTRIAVPSREGWVVKRLRTCCHWPVLASDFTTRQAVSSNDLICLFWRFCNYSIFFTLIHFATTVFCYSSPFCYTSIFCNTLLSVSVRFLAVSGFISRIVEKYGSIFLQNIQNRT